MNGARRDPEPLSLVLKRREDDQHGLRSPNLLRVHRNYLPLAERGRGQVCVIYVPGGSAPSAPSTEGHYIARTVLTDVTSDPTSRERIILHLDDVRRFRNPVAYQSGGYIVETGEQFGRRDRSSEQKDIRPISQPRLQQILQLGNLSLPFSTEDESVADLSPLASHQPGFLDTDMRRQRAAERARSTRSIVLRSRYVRLRTRQLDNATCAITGFRAMLDGYFVGVSVAHILALGLGGEDWPTNALVLCHICHDLFDRYGFTLSDDLKIIWSKTVDPSHYGIVPHADGRAHVVRPYDFTLNIQNLRKHRARFLELEATRS